MTSSPRRALQRTPARIGAFLVAFLFLGVALTGARELSDYRADLLARLDLDRSGPPAAYANPGPTADPAKAALVFAGDSRIASWPTPETIAGSHVINLGRYGETTAQLLARLDDDIIAREPRLVVLQSGINDLKAIGVFRSKGEEIEARCWENLRSVIDRLVAIDIPVVVLTIFPVGTISPLRLPIWSNRTLEAVARVNQRIRGIDEPRVTVFDSDTVFADDGRMRPDYVIDDFHINDAAYQSLSKRIVPVLEGLLSSEPGRTER